MTQSTQPNNDHVLLDTTTGAFRCDHCGQVYAPTLPAPIDMMVAMSDAFIKLHRSCEKPAAAAFGGNP